MTLKDFVAKGLLSTIIASVLSTNFAKDERTAVAMVFEDRTVLSLNIVLALGMS